MALTVTGLDPASGPEGARVLITGTEFSEFTSRVRFGTFECGLSYTVVSDTEILATVPAGTGTVYVYVTTPSGTNAAGAAFTYSPYRGGSNAIPTVTALSSNTAPGYDGEGAESVTITGTGFTTARAVVFGPTLAEAINADFTISSSTSIVCTSPRGEPGTTAYVFVENAFGVSTDDDDDNQYEYLSSAIPVVTSLTPNKMLPGFEVQIVGTGFTLAVGVRFGDLGAVYRIESDVLIKATVPGDPSLLGSAVEVYVQNPWGESTTHATFTYSTLGTLKTAATTSPTGAVAGLGKTSTSNWITSSGNVAVTLTPSYSGAPASYIESTWYRLDNGNATKYSAAFNVSGEGSHKLEYWSVGKDGIIEAANVGYVNIVATKTLTVAGTSMLGAVLFVWNTLHIPGERYEVYIGTTSTPTVLETTTPASEITYYLAAGATGVYCRLKSIDPDGVTSGYSASAGPIVALQSQATDLADGAISSAKLAPSIKPPILVAALPTLPSAAYPANSLVLLTTDGKLYKTTTGLAGSWVAVVNTADLTGTVSAVQIAAGAVDATKLAAAVNAVIAAAQAAADAAQTDADTALTTANGKNKVVFSTSDASGTAYATGDVWFKKSGALIVAQWEFVSGAWAARTLDNAVIANLNAGKLTAGYIDAARINAATITGTLIAGDTIVAGNIAAGAITASELAANAVTAGKIAAGTIVAADIAALAITGDRVAANAITAAKIAAGTITAAEIAADTITAGKIAAGAIGAEEIASQSIFVEHLVVADFENLIPNSNSESDPTGMDVDPLTGDLDFRGVTSANKHNGARCRRVVGKGTGTNAYILVSPVIPVAVNDEFHFKAWTRCGTAEAGFGCRLYLIGVEADGTFVSGLGVSSYNSTITWTEQQIDAVITQAILTADPTIVGIVARCIFNGTEDTNYGYFDDMLFRKKSRGELIVEGTITADRLDVTDVDANFIQTLDLNASKITSGTLSAGRIAVGSIPENKSAGMYLLPYRGLEWNAARNNGGIRPFTNPVQAADTTMLQYDMSGHSLDLTPSAGCVGENMYNVGTGPTTPYSLTFTAGNTDQWFSAPAATIIPSSSWMIEAWLYPIWTHSSVPFSHGVTSVDGWCWFQTSETSMRIRLNYSGGYQDITVNMTDSEWCHYAFWYNATVGTGGIPGGRWYKDGVAQGAGIVDIPDGIVVPTSRQFFMGTYGAATTTYNWHGKVHGFRYYSAAVGASYATANYNYGYTSPVGTSLVVHGDMLVDGTVTADSVVANIEIVTPSIHSADTAPYDWEITTSGEIKGTTITGGTIRTAASGERIELSAGLEDRMLFYTDVGTSSPGQAKVISAVVGTQEALQLISPIPSGGSSSWLALRGGTSAADRTAEINAAGGFTITAPCLVSGSLKPSTDCASGTSDDGIWINDLTTAARRWKLYMYGGKLIARYGSGGDEYETIGP